MSFATQDIVIDLNGSSTFLGTGSAVNVEGFGGLTTGSGNDQLTSTGGDWSRPINTGAGNDTITLQVGASKTVEGQQRQRPAGLDLHRQYAASP